MADPSARDDPGGSAARSAQSLRERDKLRVQRGGRLALDPTRANPVHSSRWRRAGSRVDGETRWLDDHLHDVPDPVCDLLEIVGESVPHAVDVVLERDGAFPPFGQLLAQLDRATALARGRTRRRAA
jgi:uncharacterized protein (UPF0276 family)